MAKHLYSEFIRFQLNILRFVSVFVILFLLMLTFSIYYYNNIKFNLGEKQGVILGDSQTEGGLNDSILNNYKNLGNSGTSLLYSYTKIRLLKKQNPNLNQLILGIGAKSFEKDKESKWVLNEDIIIARCELIPYEGIEEISELIWKIGFWKSILILPFRTFQRSISSKEKSEILGGFKPLSNEKTNNNILKFTTKNNGKIDTSKFELKYLRKIRDFCSQEKIKFIVVKLPIHSPLKNYYNPDLDSIIAYELNSQLVLDYSKINLDSSFYKDMLHLNYKGSELISKKINSDLEY